MSKFAHFCNLFATKGALRMEQETDALQIQSSSFHIVYLHLYYHHHHHCHLMIMMIIVILIINHIRIIIIIFQRVLDSCLEKDFSSSKSAVT